MAELTENLRLQSLRFIVRYSPTEDEDDEFGDFRMEDDPYPHLYDATRLLLERCPELRHLYLQSGKFENVSEEELSSMVLRNCPQLDTFVYDNHQKPLFGYTDLDAGRRYQNMCVITNSRLVNGFVSILQHLRNNLKVLRLTSDGIRGASWKTLKDLGGFPHLKRLRIRGTYDFNVIRNIPTKSIIRILQMSPNVELLELEAIDLVDDALFDALGSMKHLIHLQLACCHRINIPGLQRFASTTVSLQSLDIVEHVTDCTRKTTHHLAEDMITALSGLRELRKLCLSHFNAPITITRSFVDDLKSSVLSTARMDTVLDGDEAAVILANVPSIEYIELRGCESRMDKKQNMATLRERTRPILIVNNSRSGKETFNRALDGAVTYNSTQHLLLPFFLRA